jgi:hypothetical protein
MPPLAAVALALHHRGQPGQVLDSEVLAVAVAALRHRELKPVKIVGRHQSETFCGLFTPGLMQGVEQHLLGLGLPRPVLRPQQQQLGFTPGVAVVVLVRLDLVAAVGVVPLAKAAAVQIIVAVV